MQKGTIRLCILGCILWALFSSAAAYCGTTTGQQSCQVVQAPLRKLSCNVGKHGGVQYQPLIQDHRFQGGDFKESCLVNAGVTCANPENAGQPVTTTDSCCSCFLYARYCHGQSGKFVTNHSPSGSDHTLVMPTSACTGIENWDSFGCPGESIWDEAHSQLTSAGRDALWGMSINPVGRRGQHQMHVHLAQVDSSLMNAIVKGVQAKQSKFYVDCSLSGSKHRLDGCTYSATQCSNCPEVHIKSNTNKPSAADPFSTAYGPKPSNSNTNALQASTLVLKLPNTVATDTWAVVINPNGPAECFFAKKAGSDLLTACPQ